MNGIRPLLQGVGGSINVFHHQTKDFSASNILQTDGWRMKHLIQQADPKVITELDQQLLAADRHEGLQHSSCDHHTHQKND